MKLDNNHRDMRFELLRIVSIYIIILHHLILHVAINEYVATMHEVQESKIVRRLHSGRIKEVITECEKNSTENRKNNPDKEEIK